MISFVSWFGVLSGLLAVGLMTRRHLFIGFMIAVVSNVSMFYYALVTQQFQIALQQGAYLVLSWYGIVNNWPEPIKQIIVEDSKTSDE